MEHRNGSRGAVGLQPAADLEAVQVGEADIQDHERRSFSGREFEGGGAAGCLNDYEPGGAQRMGAEVTVGLLIIDAEDDGRATSVLEVILLGHSTPPAGGLLL